MAGFRRHLQEQPQVPAELAGVDLGTFHYGDWLRERGYDFRTDQAGTPLFSDYYSYQCAAITTHFTELGDYAREYGRSVGREVLVSGNFFNLDPHYLPLAAEVDLIITEMRNTTYRQPEWYRYVDAFRRYAGASDVIVVENPYGGIVPDLVEALAVGRGYDRLRLSLYEAAAFGANMSVPYGSWMGATIQDSFWAPHALLTEIQDFVAETESLRSAQSGHEVAVVYGVVSQRALVTQADSGDNLVNARDETVKVPFRRATEGLSRASVPFDVVLATDGELAGDRFDAGLLAAYRTVVLPGCWWLTEHQVEALVEYLDGGGRVLATGDLATNQSSPGRDRLREHPNVTSCALADVPARLPDGPQVVTDGGIAVNLHQLDDGVAVHLVNYGYHDEHDTVAVMETLDLTVRLDSSVASATAVRPGRSVETLELVSDGDSHRVRLTGVGLYTVVVLR
ncbi:MAG TPA: hypothetical protein VK401_11615, partial [Propionibacteriaceae bacterium]|nr:hypothetical protein [Propionibacteriaceae bacterium]